VGLLVFDVAIRSQIEVDLISCSRCYCSLLTLRNAYKLRAAKLYPCLEAKVMPAQVVLSFPETSLDQGNRLASSLADDLRDLDPTLIVERQKHNPQTQDFGATLAIIVGSAAASAIGKGIATWLARNSGARLTIRTKDGEVLGQNLDSRDAARIAAAFSPER
jgi:hypothetical protein